MPEDAKSAKRLYQLAKSNPALAFIIVVFTGYVKLRRWTDWMSLNKEVESR